MIYYIPYIDPMGMGDEMEKMEMKMKKTISKFWVFFVLKKKIIHFIWNLMFGYISQRKAPPTFDRFLIEMGNIPTGHVGSRLDWLL